MRTLLNAHNQLCALLNLNPNAESQRMRFDNSAIHAAILRDPKAARGKFHFEAGGYSVSIPPIFMVVALGGSLDVVQRFYDGCPEAIHEMDNRGWTLLHLACRYKAPEEVVLFLAEKEPTLIGKKDRWGRLALHYACRYNEMRVVELLVLRSPKSIEEKDRDGWTALHHAFKNVDSQVEIVKFLLEEYPKSVEWRDSAGWTPLHHACARKGPSFELVSLLAERHLEAVTVKDRDGRTPIHVVCSYKAPAEVVRWLLELNVGAVEEKDNWSWTPLHYACSNGVDLDVVKLLAERHPAGLAETNNRRKTPLALAKEYKASPETLTFLETLHKLLGFEEADRDEEVKKMLLKSSGKEWRSRVAPILDFRPLVVHRMELHDGLLPTLLHKVGRGCKLHTMLDIVRGAPGMFEPIRVKLGGSSHEHR